MSINLIIKFTDNENLKREYIDILYNTIKIFDQLLGEPPLKYRPLEVYFRDKGPHCHLIDNDCSNYNIGLNIPINDVHFDKTTYQFAHEICHIYCFHSNCQIRVNNWLIESICEMSSLFVLDILSQNNNNFKELKIKPDSQYYHNYKENTIKDYFNRNSLNINILNDKIIQDFPIPVQYDRDKNKAVALVLLP